VTDPSSAGEAIFHLSTPEAWLDAQRTGEVVPPSLASEGFVHCSAESQLAGTIARHFAGVDELVLLRLHPDLVAADVRWEESRPGERYPHLYRAINAADIAEVVPWRR